MKQLLAIIICFTISASTILAGSMTVHCFPPGKSKWSFHVELDKRDIWDSSKDENPPLSVKKAKDLAINFMKKVPFGDKNTGWSISKISLIRMCPLPEYWVYQIQFYANPKADTVIDTIHEFNILVRMDGTIPKPEIKEKEK